MATIVWNQLPDVSLIEVYRYLRDVDKLSMACVCKNWYRLFSSSVLWRERKIVFNSLAADRTLSKETAFLNKYGQYLNKLKLGFGQPSFKSCAVISKAAESYLRRLTLRNDIHLKEIDLDNLQMEQHWHFILSRNRLVTALCRMLRKQRYLQSVYLTSARMRIFDGCRILEALAKGPTASTIRVIYMENLFETNVYPIRQIRYVNAMSRFLNLEQIHLNYKYLNSQVLKMFGKKLSKTLEHLSLMLEGDIRGIEIRSEHWEEFTKNCPKVRVGIYLCTTIIRGNDLRPPFVRGIPVSEVYMTSWARIDDTEERLGTLLTHMGNNYKFTLESLGLCFDRHQPIDRELLYLLNKCPRIRDLSLECRLSVDTVISICKLHHDKKLTFTGVNIVVPDLDDGDWTRIHNFSEYYLADISGESVNIGPNDFGSGNGTSSSDSTVSLDEEDGHDDHLFRIEVDPGWEPDPDDDDDPEVEIPLNRFMM